MKQKICICAIAMFCAINTFGQVNDTLKIGYYKTAPFVFSSKDQLQGINIWLWEKIQKEYPLPHEFVEVPLVELVDGLSNNSIDISIVPLSITEQRSKIMDFSPPYFIAYSSMLVPSAGTTEKMLLAVGSFFNLDFFKAIFALFLVILVFGLLLWVFEQRKNNEEFAKGFKGIWDGIWWSAVTMTTVGYGDKSPKSVGGRFIALIWMFVAIMIISGFTAAITSSLTVSQLSWSYSDINDFKEKEIGTIGKSATENWLKDNFFNELTPYQDTEEAFSRLKEGNIDALAYDDPALQYLIRNQENNEYEILPIRFNEQMYAFGFSEELDPEIVENISNVLLKITESHDWTVVLSEYGLLEND